MEKNIFKMKKYIQILQMAISFFCYCITQLANAFDDKIVARGTWEESCIWPNFQFTIFDYLHCNQSNPFLLFTNILSNFLGQLSYEGKTSLIRQLLKAQSFSHQSPSLKLSSGGNTFIFQISKSWWGGRSLKRLMLRMHFIMSQVLQRPKHKGTNFATPKT